MGGGITGRHGNMNGGGPCCVKLVVEARGTGVFTCIAWSDVVR